MTVTSGTLAILHDRTFITLILLLNDTTSFEITLYIKNKSVYKTNLGVAEFEKQYQLVRFNRWLKSTNELQRLIIKVIKTT